MEDQILSREEIADLLQNLQDGQSGDDEQPLEELDIPSVGKRVTRIDLLRLPTSGRWKLPNLDIIYEGFGRNYGVTMTNQLQRAAVVKLSDITSMDFEVFLQQIAKRHTAIGIFKLDPLKGGGLLVFENKLSSALVEVMLGGSGEVNSEVQLDRPLTAIEMNLVRSIMEFASDELTKAFSSVEELKPELLKVETNPRLVNIVAHETAVIVATFTVMVENLGATMSLVVAQPTLEPLRERLKDGAFSSERTVTEEWKPLLEEHFDEIPIDTTVRFETVKLTAREILDLDVGDFIELNCDPSSPIFLDVEGKTKFRGKQGSQNGNKAIQIIGEHITRGE